MSEQNISTQQLYINQCIADIEQKLNWGPVDTWANFDFEKLSDDMQEQTGIYLSVTTLKRVFGKLKYDHDPSSTTLNTLASYLGFADWRDYIQGKKITDKVKKAPDTSPLPVRSKTLSKYWYSASFICLLLLIIVGLSAKKNEVYDPNDFSFSADKVYSEGVPNSVIFTYNAEKATTDSIFIVQSWDITRKTKVSSSGDKHSAIYYYPGFFKAKLLVDKQVVRSYDLQISSNGWLGLVEEVGPPTYFKKEEITVAEGVRIDSTLLAQYHYNLSPEAPKVRFFHQGDLGELMNDHFVFETELKNDYNDGNNACQYVEVLIHCKDDIIIIPLCSKACVGNAYLYAAGMARNSKDSDLSGFGADLTIWTPLRVESKNKQIAFFVNGKLADSFVFPNEATGIVGVQYRFNGTGAVKFARFQSGETWINLK